MHAQSSTTSPSETGLLSLARSPDFMTRSKTFDDTFITKESRRDFLQTNGDSPDSRGTNSNSPNFSQDALSSLIASLGGDRPGSNTPDSVLSNSNLTNTHQWSLPNHQVCSSFTNDFF